MEKQEPGVSKNLLQMLNDLQGKICFVKEMTVTNVRPLDQEGRSRRSRPCQLSLPKLFAEANRRKIRSNDVVFHSCLLDRTWSLRLAHYPARGEFAFTSGWRGFVTDNGVLKGDILVFSLTAISEFVVYIFDSQGLPKPSGFATKLNVSPRIQRVVESLGNKREVAAEENENKPLGTRSRTRAQTDDGSADLASNAARPPTFHCKTRSTKAKTRSNHCVCFSDQEKLVKEADQEAPIAMRLTRNNNRAEVSGRNLKRKIHAPPKPES